MGIWAGIKYALNSTLGTENFKSLDKIFTEQLRVRASDEPLKLFISTTTNFHYDDSYANSFIPDLSGTVRLYISGHSHSSGVHRLYFKCKKGDEEIVHETIQFSNNETIHRFDISVENGQEYTVSWDGDSSSPSSSVDISYFAVSGDPLYGKVIS